MCVWCTVDTHVLLLWRQQEGEGLHSAICVCETTSHTLAGRKVLVSCRQDNETSKHCVMARFHEGIFGAVNMRKKENPLKLHLTHCHF